MHYVTISNLQVRFLQSGGLICHTNTEMREVTCQNENRLFFLALLNVFAYAFEALKLITL